MSILIRACTLIPVGLAIVACTGKYVSPPPSEAVARMKFSGKQTSVYIDDGDSCRNRKAVPKEAWSSTYVQAGERIWMQQGIEFYVTGTYGGGDIGCGFRYSFVPLPETTYVSELIYDGTSGKCNISIRRFLPTGEQVPEDSVRKEHKLSCL
jgi:hypothetical protein